MPNHCYNEIQIVSDKGLEPIRKLIVNENKLPIEEWTELNKDTQLIDFNLVAPQPEFDSPELESFDGWREWNCENWEPNGTLTSVKFLWIATANITTFLRSNSQLHGVHQKHGSSV